MTRKTLIQFVGAICISLPISSTVADNISRSTTSVLNFQEQLAEKGSPQAQYKLGSMYEFGIGTEINLKIASDWYKKAVSTGSSDAENRLKYLEIRKNGFDPTRDSNWLNSIKSAADEGNQQSAMLMGQLYSYGIGVRKNLETALNYLNNAGVLRNPVVPYEIARVEKERKALAKRKADLNKTQKKANATKKANAKKKAADNAKNAEAAKKAAEDAKKAEAKKKADAEAEKRRKYEEVMRKLAEEERILKEQQEWSEGKGSE